MCDPKLEKALKEKYLEAPKTKDGYTFAQISRIRDMAEKGAYPDWRFSDEECNLWEMFALLFARANRTGKGE